VNCKGRCRIWFCSGLQQCHQIHLEREGKPPQIINILDEMRTSLLPNVSQKVKRLNDVQISLIFFGQQKMLELLTPQVRLNILPRNFRYIYISDGDLVGKSVVLWVRCCGPTMVKQER
jgi:hypothetical protein